MISYVQALDCNCNILIRTASVVCGDLVLVPNRWTEDEVGAQDAQHVAAVSPFRSHSIQQLATVRNMESFASQPFVACLQQSSIQGEPLKISC